MEVFPTFLSIFLFLLPTLASSSTIFRVCLMFLTVIVRTLHFGTFFRAKFHFAYCKEAAVWFFYPEHALEVHPFWQPQLFREQLKIINFLTLISCTFRRGTCLHSCRKFSQIYCWWLYFSFSSAYDRCKPNIDKIHWIIQIITNTFSYPRSRFCTQCTR